MWNEGRAKRHEKKWGIRVHEHESMDSKLSWSAMRLGWKSFIFVVFFINFFWKSFMTWMLIAQVPVGWHCIPTVSTMRWILILQMHCFLLFLWKCSVVFCRVRSAVFLSELHLHYFFSVSANQGLSLPEHKSFACLACVPNSVFLFYILFCFCPLT